VYRIRTYPEARDAVAALPAAALVGYAEARAVLALVPWNGRSINGANPDGAVRQFVFGPDAMGLVTYLILERDRQVDVLEVQWLGE
jgi:hypothetical protein